MRFISPRAFWFKPRAHWHITLVRLLYFLSCWCYQVQCCLNPNLPTNQKWRYDRCPRCRRSCRCSRCCRCSRWCSHRRCSDEQKINVLRDPKMKRCHSWTHLVMIFPFREQKRFASWSIIEEKLFKLFKWRRNDGPSKGRWYCWPLRRKVFKKTELRSTKQS